MNNKDNKYHSVKSILLILVIISAFIAESAAQQPDMRRGVPSLRERIFFGGNFGIQLGTFSYVELSPVMGIWLLPRLATAAGPSFKYMSDRAGSTDVWGGKSYVRLMVINDINSILPIGMNMGIYLQAEYEALSFRSDWLTTTSDSPRIMVQTSFAGFGISQGLGRRATADVTILWTISNSGYDIYTNPEFRFGFTF